MYQEVKYESMAIVPARSASSNQDRPSMYGASFSSDGGVSSADPKPRLRWTPELHERFMDAVSQLGGSDSKSIVPASNLCVPKKKLVRYLFSITIICFNIDHGEGFVVY